MPWGTPHRVHLLPATGPKDQNVFGRHWLSSVPLYGSKRHDIAGRPMFGYRRYEGGIDSYDLAAALSGRTETVSIARGCGAHYRQWRSQGGTYDVSWLNNYDPNGRGLQTTVVISDATGPERYSLMQGGSKIGHPSHFTNLTEEYAIGDLIQGSIVRRHWTHDHGSGTKQIHSEVTPTEYDGDGAIHGYDHGGTPHDMVTYPRSPFTIDTQLHWNGRTGVHRHRAKWANPTGIPGTGTAADMLISASMVFGFDKLLVWEGGVGSTDNTNDVIYAGLASPALTSVVAVAGIVTITFASATDRIDNTIHEITVSGAVGGVSINGTHNAIFTAGGTQALFIVLGASGPYTGATVTSATQYYFRTAETQGAAARADQMVITGSLTGANGTFPGKQFQGATTGRTAFMARADNTNGFSLDDDFAVAIYTKELSPASTLGNVSTLGYLVHRPTAPSGVPNEDPMIVLYRALSWAGSDDDIPAGKHSFTTYILTGTAADVESNLAFLDTQADSTLFESW